MTRFTKVILHLSKDYLTWPTGDRKKEMIEDHRKRSGFTGCIGFIDGSLLSLNEKPFFQPNSFYNEREQQYVLGSTLVCAHNLEILYAQVGDFGTIHGLVENPENFFSSKEFVLGDETYPQKSWLLPMQHNTELSGSDIIFNKCISKMHIQAKTCVAAIKGRFPSVQNIRIKVKSRKDVNKINDWFLVCCILHNFCLKHDTKENLNHFTDVFLRENNKLRERISRIQSDDYLDSFD